MNFFNAEYGIFGFHLKFFLTCKKNLGMIVYVGFHLFISFLFEILLVY